MVISGSWAPLPYAVDLSHTHRAPISHSEVLSQALGRVCSEELLGNLPQVPWMALLAWGAVLSCESHRSGTGPVTKCHSSHKLPKEMIVRTH